MRSAPRKKATAQKIPAYVKRPLFIWTSSARQLTYNIA
jgi:hypothetical protein